jgi:glycosyltransferase involved in cell wall biosynthesis
MKLLLVNHKNPADINQFSGTSFFMSKAIREEFKDVSEFTVYETTDDIRKVINTGVYAGLRPFGNKLTSFIKGNHIKADFVLCQGGNTAVPYYNHSIPIAYWHDSTWQSYLQGYRSRKAFEQFKKDYRNLFTWDRKAFERADLLIFSSDYVAEACVKYYKVSQDKIKVIPFGANLRESMKPQALNLFLQQRLMEDRLNFTFIGKDWKRKGLPQAYSLVKKLNENHIKAHLNIVGCEPELKRLHQSAFVTNHGFLDKANQSHNEVFSSILQKTHFLLHPTISEPFGIVLCEANAYGIPVLGTNTEGLKSIVVCGENGYLFKRTEFLQGAFDRVLDLNKDFAHNYRSLFESSLTAYRQRLNWQTNVRILKATLQEFV